MYDDTLIWVGYKNISKSDKSIFDTESKKKKERKNRVRDIIVKYFKISEDNLKDDDIVDAIGIGLWYYLMAKEHVSWTLQI